VVHNQKNLMGSDGRRTSIFKINVTCNHKLCALIVDGGNIKNVVST